MKEILVVAVCVTLAACGGQAKAPATDTTSVAQQPAQSAPLDSTVQHKLLPDTLVRGDGKLCIVRPASKYAAAQLGQPFICQWH